MQNRKCLEYCYDSKQYSSQEIMEIIEKKKSEFENRKIEVQITLNEWGTYVVTYYFEKERSKILRKILKDQPKMKLLPERNIIQEIENMPEVEMKKEIVKEKKNMEKKRKKKLEILELEMLQEQKTIKNIEQNNKKLKQLNQTIKKLEKGQQKKRVEKRPQDIYGTRTYGQYKETRTYRPI